MKSIHIDITRLLSRRMEGRLPTGVDRVSLAYIEHYGSKARAILRFWGRCLLFSHSDSRALFDGLMSNDSDFPYRVRYIVARRLCCWYRNSYREAFVFNTGHSGLEKADYPRMLQRQGGYPIFFLHDLIPISHPEYCRPGEKEKHIRRINTMLDYGAGIICNSVMTRDVLEVYADSVGKKLPPIATALLASAELPSSVDTQPPLNIPYFVVLSTIESRKNHLMVLQVWRKLIAQMGEKTPKLVLIGRRGWEAESAFDLLDRCDEIKDHVLELSDCSDTELSLWLRHARALLFPSFIEGFGMPLVEAFRVNTPVIASDIVVFHEIGGDIPEYIDPIDGLGWLLKIQQYIPENSSVRAEQISRIREFSAPTWHKHFDIIDNFLERLS